MLSSGPLEFASWQLALRPFHLEVALVLGGVHRPKEVARAMMVPSYMAIAKGLDVGRQWPTTSVPIGGGGLSDTFACSKSGTDHRPSRIAHHGRGCAHGASQERLYAAASAESAPFVCQQGPMELMMPQAYCPWSEKFCCSKNFLAKAMPSSPWEPQGYSDDTL